jgi:hypothetical protein
VPTRSSWSSLSNHIARELGGARSSRSSGGGGNTYTPDSWEEISEHDQEDIQSRWMGETRSEFYDNEVTNWRDSGQALDDAKYQLAQNFDSSAEWAVNALDDFRSDDDGIPYTNEQILAALTVEEYDTGSGDGSKDPEFTFDDDKLKEPSNAPPPEQMNLPGIESPDLSTHLTPEVRDEITDVLTKAFNRQAERDADDVEPPEYLAEQVAEYQSEYWDSMDDRERYRQAERNGLLPEYDLPDDEEDDGEDHQPTETAPPATDDLTRLAASSNPKAVWAIADNPKGKDLLLGTDWYGELNLNDKESMDRFNAYVGKAKASDATAVQG